MKKIIVLALTLLCNSIASYCQTNIDTIVSEYNKNPQRAVAEYMNKATVTLKFKIIGIYYSRLWDRTMQISVYGSNSEFQNLEIVGIPYSVALKLDSHDTIIAQGLFSYRASPSYDYFKNPYLKQGKVIKVVSKDSNWIKKTVSENACNNCTTDLKKIQEYIIGSILNSARANKSLVNNPISLNVVITDFVKKGIVNYLRNGGVGGYVEEGSHKVKIAIYGLQQQTILRLNIGDTIHVKGLLSLDESLLNSQACNSELSEYKLFDIKVNNPINKRH